MVDYDDSEMGWIQDPDNATACLVFGQIPGNTYEYTRYRISHGRANKWDNSIAVEINPASDLLPGIGNYPLNVLATPIGRGTAAAGSGQARITWNYNPFGEPAEPDGFRIYNRSDVAGAFGLDLAATTYVAGRRAYSHTSSELLVGDWTFDVRTYKDGSELEGRSDSCVINDTADATTGLGDVTATAIAGGVARITWTFDPANPSTVPTRFITYHQSDAGDAWAADLDSDAYIAARRFYSRVSSELTMTSGWGHAPWGHSKWGHTWYKRRWCFKVVSAAGAPIDSGSDCCVIDGTSPGGVTSLTISE